VWPLVYAFRLSFHSYDLFAPPKARRISPIINRICFQQAAFWISASKITALIHVLPSVTAQDGSVVRPRALVMDQKIRGKTFLTARPFFLPSVTSSVAISLIFMFIFFKNGILNQALGAVGLDRLLAAVGLQPPIDWLGDTRTALPAIMVQNIWSTSGFFMIVFLAGLQDIPESLYEAARVDGATGWQQLRHITLPSLRPTTFYVVTMGLIGCFQVFDQVYVMTEGGPAQGDADHGVPGLQGGVR
jgi:multiple sugar transport system permease protein